jgi:hypothetical protein
VTLDSNKLRKIVNMLADPGSAHVAANLLATEARERHCLVADLIAETLAPPSMATPTFTDVRTESDNPFAGIGQRIDRDHYGLQSYVAHETPKAWLVEGPDGEQVWLPKSQCEHHGEDPSGRIVFTLPVWLAKAKGFPL